MKKTDKSTTTEIAKSESKEIVKKSKKTDTKGKVPRILTKKYTEKKLNHKFYKKFTFRTIKNSWNHILFNAKKNQKRAKSFILFQKLQNFQKKTENA